MLLASASLMKSGTCPDGSPMDRLMGSLPGFMLLSRVASWANGPDGRLDSRVFDMAGDHKGAGYFYEPPSVAAQVGSADTSLRHLPPSWRFAPKGEGSCRMLRVAPRNAALEPKKLGRAFQPAPVSSGRKRWVNREPSHHGD